MNIQPAEYTHNFITSYKQTYTSTYTIKEHFNNVMLLLPTYTSFEQVCKHFEILINAFKLEFTPIPNTKIKGNNIEELELQFTYFDIYQTKCTQNLISNKLISNKLREKV